MLSKDEVVYLEFEINKMVKTLKKNLNKNLTTGNKTCSPPAYLFSKSGMEKRTCMVELR